MSIADLATFLKRNVDEYLLADLESLIRLNPAPGRTAGAAGYPLLVSTFAGIELLGGLVSSSPFDRNAGAKRFAEFWIDYMYRGNANRAAAGPVLYQLARHGLAHAFVVKGNLEVVKGEPRLHLVTTGKGAISVDAVQLAIDFRTAYESQVKPNVISGTPLAKTMADRHAEMASEYGKQAAELLPILKLPLESAASSQVAPNAVQSGINTSSPAFMQTIIKSTP